ncbi:MAG: hypothetical protein KIT22_01990, partial [Verrucomicrobiae bacterium]|nr:hypothetical protein [Verrucomicrobiae bacterium]
MRIKLRFLATATLVMSAVSALAQQHVPRVLPTVLDMLKIPPARLASTTVGESTNWLAFVETTGDTVAGAEVRKWRWDQASTAPTNTIAEGGPLAYPGDPTVGRWHSVGATISAGFQAQLDALQASLSTKVSAAELPVNVLDFGADFSDLADDTDAINAAAAFAKERGRELVIPNGDVCRVRPEGVDLSDLTVNFGSVRIETTTHPTSNRNAPDKGWGLFKLSGRVVLRGNGFTEFHGRRNDATYTSYSDSYMLSALKVNGASYLRIEGIRFKGWVHQHTYLRNVDFAEIKDCVFEDTHQDIYTYRVKRLMVHHNSFIGKRFITTAVSASACNFEGADWCEYTDNYHGLAYSSVPQAKEVYATWTQFFTCFGARVVGNYYEGFTTNTTTASTLFIVFDSSWGYVGQNILASVHNSPTFIALEGTSHAVVEGNIAAGPRSYYMPFAYSATRSRTANLVTVTTTTPHGFTAGMPISVSGFGDVTYNGAVEVKDVLSTTSFTYTQTGDNLSPTVDTGATINCTRQYLGTGIYTIEANVVGNYRFPGALEWRDPGSQLRSRTEAYAITIRANTIIGFYHGIWSGASDTDIVENRLIGNIYAQIRVGTRLTAWPGI